jgi:lipopolysaccharide export LptBFGC system permease protein LptF
MGVLVSLIIVWLHFNLFVITGEIFGKNTWVSPVLAAWIPNVLFAAVGLLFLRRLE